jgi:hypothetical protein
MQTSRLLGELALLQGDTEQAEDTIDNLMGRIEKALVWVSAEQQSAQKDGRLADYQQRVAEETALNAAYQRLSQAKGKMIYGGAIPGAKASEDT